MIKEGIEKEGVSRTFLCLDLAHQAVAVSAGLLSRRPCPGSYLDTMHVHDYSVSPCTSVITVHHTVHFTKLVHVAIVRYPCRLYSFLQEHGNIYIEELNYCSS